MTHDEDLLHKRLKRLLKSSEDSKVEFKNYKDMCEKLKLPVKNGKSKEIQLARLFNFCNLERFETGYGYYFSEVYSDPDRLILQQNSIVLDMESILLLRFLEKRDSGPEILLNDYDLWYLFGFINGKYSNRQFENNFKDKYQISNAQFNYFKERSAGRFKDIVLSTLRKLVERSCIEFFPVKIITYIDNKNNYNCENVKQRIATPEEIARVITYQSEILDKMGYSTLKQVRADGKLEDYYYKRLQKIKENEPTWLHYTSGFQIVATTKKWLEKGLKNIFEEKKYYQLSINAQMKELITQSAEISYDNYIECLKKEFAPYQFLNPSLLLEENKKKCKTYKTHKDIMEEDFLNHFQLFIQEFVDLGTSIKK